MMWLLSPDGVHTVFSLTVCSRPFTSDCCSLSDSCWQLVITQQFDFMLSSSLFSLRRMCISHLCHTCDIYQYNCCNIVCLWALVMNTAAQRKPTVGQRNGWLQITVIYINICMLLYVFLHAENVDNNTEVRRGMWLFSIITPLYIFYICTVYIIIIIIWLEIKMLADLLTQQYWIFSFCLF